MHARADERFDIRPMHAGQGVVGNADDIARRVDDADTDADIAKYIRPQAHILGILRPVFQGELALPAFMVAPTGFAFALTGPAGTLARFAAVGTDRLTRTEVRMNNVFSRAISVARRNGLINRSTPCGSSWRPAALG